ncbi:MAG: hypothetical protein R3E66_08705 [bacterium]
MSAYLVLTADGKPQNMVIVAILIILAFILLRRAVFEPIRTLRRWRAISTHLNGRFFGDLSHEPMVTGTFDGVDFVAGISAHQLIPGRRERYRTLVSSPVFEGVPLGLRVYGAALDEWANDYSERRRVPTGDEVLEGNMRCEGADPEEVRAFVCAPELRDRLLRFL